MLKSFINWGGVGWDREVGSYRRVQGHWDLFWGHCRGPDLAVVGSGGGLLGAPTERGGRGRMLPEEEAAVQRGFYPESSRSQLLAFNFEK